MSRGWLVVLAKAPLPGLVKTRLCPPLAPGEAAELARCMLADVLAESARAARALELEPVLAVDPPRAQPELAVGAPAGFRVVAQRGPDLSARLSHAARQAAAAGAERVLLRGSDCPVLDLATLREALAALERADLSVCPDEDGGYSLVGLGARALGAGLGRGGLFDHPMSTPSVLEDTLGRAARLGLSAQRLPAGFDLDRFADLERLLALRHRAASHACPRTLAHLESHLGQWQRAARAGGSR